MDTEIYSRYGNWFNPPVEKLKLNWLQSLTGCLKVGRRTCLLINSGKKIFFNFNVIKSVEWYKSMKNIKQHKFYKVCLISLSSRCKCLNNKNCENTGLNKRSYIFFFIKMRAHQSLKFFSTAWNNPYYILNYFFYYIILYYIIFFLLI